MLLVFCLLLSFLVIYGANIVGPVYGQDGSTPSTGRQSKTGDAVVSQAGGKYYEDASRGVVYGASDNATGVTTPTSMSTTAICSLHNPVGSKVRIAIQKVRLSYFSGTLAAGGYYHCTMGPGQTLPSSGTAPTVYATDAGNLQAAAAQGVFRYGPTVVAPTTSTGLIMPSGFTTGQSLASSAISYAPQIDDVDGEIILEPGSQYQLQSVLGANGSTPKVSVGITWKEIPFAGSVG